MVGARHFPAHIERWLLPGAVALRGGGADKPEMPRPFRHRGPYEAFTGVTVAAKKGEAFPGKVRSSVPERAPVRGDTTVPARQEMPRPYDAPNSIAGSVRPHRRLAL